MTFDDLLNKVKSDNPITIIIKNRARKTVFVANYYTVSLVTTVLPMKSGAWRY